MTLHDRIIKLQPFYDDPGLDYEEGFRYGTGMSAQLAKQADELMAEMAEALGYVADNKAIDDGACLMCVADLTKYKTWKDQTK